MTRDERPLAAVPFGIWGVLGALLAAQIAWQTVRHPGTPAAADLPPPPQPGALRIASFGEPEAAARVAMLYIQTVDFSAGQALPYRNLDYPLFSAARIYAEVPDPERARIALEFVYQAFLRDPNRRWPWLAHAALLAKHRLNDLALARRYAAAIDRYTTAADVPLWAKQMEIFILEDMNELEAAKIMIGGLLASGTLRDPAEARFLAQRLEELEKRLAGKSVK